MFKSDNFDIRKVRFRSNIKCFEYFGQPTVTNATAGPGAGNVRTGLIGRNMLIGTSPGDGIRLRCMVVVVVEV